MKLKKLVKVDSYVIKNTIPQKLTCSLYRFLSAYYHIIEPGDFERFVIQPGVRGELAVLYGINDEIAGFTRSYKFCTHKNQPGINTYCANTYLNPQYKVHPTIKNMGLIQALQEHNRNPQDELNFLVFATNPITYEFIAELSDDIYPKPSEKVPEIVLSRINDFKKQNGWLSSSTHPMVVHSPLVPLRSQSREGLDESKELVAFYLSVNPEYLQGNALLVHIPLHVAQLNGVN